MFLCDLMRNQVLAGVKKIRAGDRKSARVGWVEAMPAGLLDFYRNDPAFM